MLVCKKCGNGVMAAVCKDKDKSNELILFCVHCRKELGLNEIKFMDQGERRKE